MKVTNSVFYVGVQDHKVDLFEGQFVVPNGMAYNSYIVCGSEKVAVMDSVDIGFGAEWLSNIDVALDGRKPDYLVVQHMEPDHSSSIKLFMERFPEAVVVSSAMAFVMMGNYFGGKWSGIVVKEGDCLDLGDRKLHFVAAPNVHWPEVIVTYDDKDKILFSADGFGKFGAIDADEDWACEARRYYFGIVGKFGAPVQALLKKAVSLDIAKICPLHGPILTENLGYYIDLYNTWSSYKPESEGIFIAYTSVYGNTKKAALKLAEILKRKSTIKVSLADLARDDMAEAVEDAFRYDRLVLATTTYNGAIFPFMRTFIHELLERNYSNRRIGLIENGSWAPMAIKTMRKYFEEAKGITFAENCVTLRCALSSANVAELEALADELLKA